MRCLLIISVLLLISCKKKETPQKAKEHVLTCTTSYNLDMVKTTIKVNETELSSTVAKEIFFDGVKLQEGDDVSLSFSRTGGMKWSCVLSLDGSVIAKDTLFYAFKAN